MSDFEFHHNFDKIPLDVQTDILQELVNTLHNQTKYIDYTPAGAYLLLKMSLELANFVNDMVVLAVDAVEQAADNPPNPEEVDDPRELFETVIALTKITELLRSIDKNGKNMGIDELKRRVRIRRNFLNEEIRKQTEANAKANAETEATVPPDPKEFDPIDLTAFGINCPKKGPGDK